MIFCKGNKYIFSKDVYLASDERVEKLNDNQIDQYDGLEVQVGHSYLGYIDNSRISSSWCKEVK
ncbi:MAG: Topoisomerase I C-terminal domain-containing protein [uncultured Clostridium sp.]